MKGITEHWVGCILGHGFGVTLDFGVLFIIIITTFTTLDILPGRDVSAHFGGIWVWERGHGVLFFLEGNGLWSFPF
jgi:hypothetical protein